MSFLVKEGLMNPNILTVTGKSLGENLDRWQEKHGHKWEGQDVIRPINNPIKSTGHIRFVQPPHSPSLPSSSRLLPAF